MEGNRNNDAVQNQNIYLLKVYGSVGNLVQEQTRVQESHNSRR